MRGNRATWSQSSRLQREIRVPERARQSEQKLEKHRQNNEKRERLEALAARCAQAELESQGLNDGPGNQRQEPLSQAMTPQRPSRRNLSESNSDASRPNISISTNASLPAEPRDEILEELQHDKARTKEIIEWFKTNQGIDVSTLDLPELKNLFGEQGPGTTLSKHHNPYPNIQIKAQASRTTSWASSQQQHSTLDANKRTSPSVADDDYTQSKRQRIGMSSGSTQRRVQPAPPSTTIPSATCPAHRSQNHANEPQHSHPGPHPSKQPSPTHQNQHARRPLNNPPACRSVDKYQACSPLGRFHGRDHSKQADDTVDDEVEEASDDDTVNGDCDSSKVSKQYIFMLSLSHKLIKRPRDRPRQSEWTGHTLTLVN
ncbi:hypothetical protein FRC12_001021 [Ceratobasidium sp. 428]|nr:hypothetical protein FRC12_001021 [Ceratobasidium sp. 428]